MGLLTSIVIYCNNNSWALHEYKGRELQELVTISCMVRGEHNKHPGNTTELSGIAAEAAELSGWMDGACCFPYCSLFVLSYSGLSLLSLQSLRRLGTETVGGFCGCTFLFRTRSTHAFLLRTKYWGFFCLLWFFPIWDSVYSLTARGPSTKFLTPWKDSLLEQLLYLYPRIGLVSSTESTSE